MRDGEVPDLVIGADTIVDLDGVVLEKPDGYDGAYSMLSRCVCFCVCIGT